MFVWLLLLVVLSLMWGSDVTLIEVLENELNYFNYLKQKWVDGSSFPHNSFNTMINTNWLLHLNILFICQLCLGYDLTVSIMNVLQNNYQKMSTILHKYFTSFIAWDSVFKLCKLWWQNLLWQKFFYFFFVFLFSYFLLQTKNKQQQKKEGGFMSESPWEKDHIFVELVLLSLKQQMTRVSSKERTNLWRNDGNLKCHFGDLFKWTK